MTDDDHRSDGSTSLGISPNLLAPLAYLFGLVSGIVILLIEKRHPEVRFHAAQSILLSVAIIGLSIATGVLLFIPFIGALISMAVSLGGFVLWVYLMIQGFRLNHVELPIIGGWAMQLAGRS
jgi:uncharacterized membrane protein